MAGNALLCIVSEGASLIGSLSDRHRVAGRMAQDQQGYGHVAGLQGVQWTSVLADLGGPACISFSGSAVVHHHAAEMFVVVVPVLESQHIDIPACTIPPTRTRRAAVVPVIIGAGLVRLC